MSGRMACVVWIAVVLAGVSGLVGEEAGKNAEEASVVTEELLERWIVELADERFAVREKAMGELLGVGERAVPALERASASDVPERRIRAAELLLAIRFRNLMAKFEALGKRRDEDIDVEYGMWLIALILDPKLERNAIDEKFEEMAAAVRREIGGVEPASLPPRKAVEVLCSVLKKDFGMKGDEVNYAHPDNSSVHRVIARGRGLPILLSEVAVAVARRLDLPIVGVGIPGRYMIKYDGARAPEGHEKADIIVDPFGSWVEITAAQLERSIRGFDVDEHLRPSPARATLVRMMFNMEAHASAQGDPHLSLVIPIYRSLLTPVESDEP